MKVLLTGGNGYIGKSLSRSISSSYILDVITRKEFDLTDSRLTNDWFDKNEYDVVIHSAATGGSRLYPDNSSTLDDNLRMHYNLLNNKHRFKKLISFGSGAELFRQDTPYGLSKKIISDTIKRTENWYNIRIFGVFDENEINTRFIKSNIIRYIKKQPMSIHSNRIMDFFFMGDLISLVRHYIEIPNPPKEVNCSYSEKMSLSEIANIINNLDKHHVAIDIGEEIQDTYCGDALCIPLNLVGLRQGIQETYRNLMNKLLNGGL